MSGRAARTDVNGGVVVQKIGHQHFDDGLGVEPSNLPDGLGEVPGAAVGQIVPGHGGDDDVFELQAAGGFGDAGRFVGFREGAVWRC